MSATHVFWSTSVDVYWYVQNVDYATAQGAASGTRLFSNTVGVDNDWRATPEWYMVCRAGLQIDTTKLPNSAAIVSATLSLYKQSKEEADAGQATVHVVDGSIIEDSPVNEDYGDLKAKTTSGGSVAYGDVVDDGYTDIALNGDGLLWIVKGGITKLGLRAAGDINISTPTGHNYVDWYQYRKGAGYQPKLAITFTLVGPFPTHFRV